MIVSKSFGFPVEEGLFKKVVEILMNEYGLVDGHGEPSTGDYRVLIWEDEEGIGRYRVHCFGNYDWQGPGGPGDGKRRDVFSFRYWINDARFKREIFSRDPMREPLQKILGLSENRFDAKHDFFEATVEQLEKIVLGAQD